MNVVVVFVAVDCGDDSLKSIHPSDVCKVCKPLYTHSIILRQRDQQTHNIQFGWPSYVGNNPNSELCEWVYIDLGAYGLSGIYAHTDKIVFVNKQTL